MQSRRKFLAIAAALPALPAVAQSSPQDWKNAITDAAVQWSDAVFDSQTAPQATLDFLDLVNRYKLTGRAR